MNDLDINNELFSPIIFEEDNNDHNEKLKVFEDGFRNRLKLNPNLPFKNMMANLSNKFGANQVDEQFYIAAKAWNNVTNNSLSKQEIDNIHLELFGGANHKDFQGNFSEDKSVKLQFFKDIFIPVGTYLAIMQLPILIFISRFFKGFITIVSKLELMQISFFVFALGVLGLIVLKSEYQNIKIKFFKDLYSEKSQTIHFFSSLVIIAISAYEFTIFLIIVGLIIWSVTNFKKLRSAFEKSQLKKSLSIIWKKIIDVLGY